MHDRIYERTLNIANYTIDKKSTVRETGKAFGISKSTVHKDLTERLPIYNKKLAHRVRKVLDYNLKERHIRGGEALKQKYNNIERDC